MLPHSRGATASPGATSCQRGPSRARLRRDELPPTCGKRLRADPGRLSAKSSEAAVAFCHNSRTYSAGRPCVGGGRGPQDEAARFTLMGRTCYVIPTIDQELPGLAHLLTTSSLAWLPDIRWLSFARRLGSPAGSTTTIRSRPTRLP